MTSYSNWLGKHFWIYLFRVKTVFYFKNSGEDFRGKHHTKLVVMLKNTPPLSNIALSPHPTLIISIRIFILGMTNPLQLRISICPTFKQILNIEVVNSKTCLLPTRRDLTLTFSLLKVSLIAGWILTYFEVGFLWLNFPVCSQDCWRENMIRVVEERMQSSNATSLTWLSSESASDFF